MCVCVFVCFQEAGQNLLWGLQTQAKSSGPSSPIRHSGAKCNCANTANWVQFVASGRELLARTGVLLFRELRSASSRGSASWQPFSPPSQAHTSRSHVFIEQLLGAQALCSALEIDQRPASDLVTSAVEFTTSQGSKTQNQRITPNSGSQLWGKNMEAQGGNSKKILGKAGSI